MHIENKVGIMSVTCLFGKCKALFLSTAQAAPKQTIRQKQYNINTPFTSTNNKHARKGKGLVFINLFCVCCSLGSKILGVMA
jgi:hypothetical protein